MPRDEDMDRRLNNWARWKHGAGSGGMGYSSPGFDGAVGASGYREAVVPTVDCEAEETDRGLQTLEMDLQGAVGVVYAGSGSAARKAALLGVSERTVQLRIVSAHRKLSGWLTDERTRAQAERDRVEGLNEKIRRGFTPFG